MMRRSATPVCKVFRMNVLTVTDKLMKVMILRATVSKEVMSSRDVPATAQAA